MGSRLIIAGLALGGIASVALSAFVWARRDGGAGKALAAMLLAVAIWHLAYVAELVATVPGSIRLWGDVKYVGITALAPSWLLFVLFWTGRGHLVRRRLVAALMVEPIVLLSVLANPGTHDLVRSIERLTQVDRVGPKVGAGPLFWIHLAYNDITMLGAVAFFVASLLRKSDVYRSQVVVLTIGAVLPWLVNLGYNLEIGPLAYVDLTAPAFLVSCSALTWGLLRQHLLRLAPIAERQVVAGLVDAVLVLDIFGHVVESNPAAQRVLAAADNVPPGSPPHTLPPELAALATAPATAQALPVQLSITGVPRDFEVNLTDLPDHRGQAGGRLIVMRDVTERRARERQLTTLLMERARVADTLSRSLRPDVLPVAPGVRLAAAYRPAGAGREIGGDFYDVYAAESGWHFAIGDVSGKGASAAAVTALARYSLRAFASTGRTPARTLTTLNRHILNNQAMEETYLTVAHGVFTARGDGTVDVRFTLGGHPPPLLMRAADGSITRVGVLGAAVGLFADLRTRDSHVTLAPGDTLVFYTDGVTEARRGPAFFGEEGLVRCLSQLAGTDAQTLAAGVLRTVMDFQAQDASDDIAALVIQAPHCGEDAAQDPDSAD